MIEVEPVQPKRGDGGAIDLAKSLSPFVKCQVSFEIPPSVSFETPPSGYSDVLGEREGATPLRHSA
jgi:hypothetical protein